MEQDRALMENELLVIKGVCDLYLHGTIESTTAEVHAAFEDALKLCKKDDLLLISGSLYMIGEMRGIIKKHFSK